MECEGRLSQNVCYLLLKGSAEKANYVGVSVRREKVTQFQLAGLRKGHIGVCFTVLSTLLKASHFSR